MALNDDWLADVRRWYFDERDQAEGRLAPATDAAPAALPSDAMGYEAAWPSAPEGEVSPAVHTRGAARTDLR
jgi:hypothetical protein